MLAAWIMLTALATATAYELPITRSTSKDQVDNGLLYTLSVSLNKQSFDFKLNLSSTESWVKGSNCSLCTGPKCDEKCREKLGSSSSGMVCNTKKPCKKLNQTVNTTVVEGFKINAELTNKRQKEPWQVTWTVAEKLHRPMPLGSLIKGYDGELNLFHKEDGFAFDHFSLIRSKKETMFLVDEPPKKYLDKTDEKITLENALDNKFQVNEVEFNRKSIQSKKLYAQISLNTRYILLPEAIFESLMLQVLSLYDPSCTIKNTVVNCSGKPKIDRLKDVALSFKLSGQSVSIPFESLIQEHSKKGLVLLVNRSSNEQIILGEALFENFALTYDMPKKTAYLSRLENEWSKKLKQIEEKAVKSNTKSKKVEEESEETPHPTVPKPGFVSKIKETAKHLRHPTQKQSHPKKEQESHEKSETIGSRFFLTIETIVFWMFKLIFVLALIAVLINLYYHRRRLQKWFGKNMKLSESSLLRANNNGYSPAFEEEIDPTPTMAQGYDAKAATKEFWEENSVEGI